MRMLKISIVSFINHARDRFNKIYKYKIPDGAKNKWLASHTSKLGHIIMKIRKDKINLFKWCIFFL